MYPCSTNPGDDRYLDQSKETTASCCPMKCHNDRYYWVKKIVSMGVPNSAVKVGVDKCGNSVFVGKAEHEGNQLPAKIIPARKFASVGYQGREYPKNEYEVLCERRFKWEVHNTCSIPNGAVEGGMTSCGETLYIGRVCHEGTHTVGEVRPSQNTCHITVCGKELLCKQYEILILE